MHQSVSSESTRKRNVKVQECPIKQKIQRCEDNAAEDKDPKELLLSILSDPPDSSVTGWPHTPVNTGPTTIPDATKKDRKRYAANTEMEQSEADDTILLYNNEEDLDLADRAVEPVTVEKKVKKRKTHTTTPPPQPSKVDRPKEPPVKSVKSKTKVIRQPAKVEESKSKTTSQKTVKSKPIKKVEVVREPSPSPSCSSISTVSTSSSRSTSCSSSEGSSSDDSDKEERTLKSERVRKSRSKEKNKIPEKRKPRLSPERSKTVNPKRSITPDPPKKKEPSPIRSSIPHSPERNIPPSVRSSLTRPKERRSHSVDRLLRPEEERKRIYGENTSNEERRFVNLYDQHQRPQLATFDFVPTNYKHVHFEDSKTFDSKTFYERPNRNIRKEEYSECRDRGIYSYDQRRNERTRENYRSTGSSNESGWRDRLMEAISNNYSNRTLIINAITEGDICYGFAAASNNRLCEGFGFPYNTREERNILTTERQHAKRNWMRSRVDPDEIVRFSIMNTNNPVLIGCDFNKLLSFNERSNKLLNNCCRIKRLASDQLLTTNGREICFECYPREERQAVYCTKGNSPKLFCQHHARLHTHSTELKLYRPTIVSLSANEEKIWLSVFTEDRYKRSNWLPLVCCNLRKRPIVPDEVDGFSDSQLVMNIARDFRMEWKDGNGDHLDPVNVVRTIQNICTELQKSQVCSINEVLVPISKRLVHNSYNRNRRCKTEEPTHRREIHW